MIECIRQRIFGVDIQSRCDKCHSLKCIVQMPEPTVLNGGLFWEKMCLDCKYYKTKVKPKSEWRKDKAEELRPLLETIVKLDKKLKTEDVITDMVEKKLHEMNTLI